MGLRVKLYEEAMRLREEGLSYRRIVEEIWRRFRIRLSKSHVSYWLRGIHTPYNGRRIPSLKLLKPSEELAYVIGVVLGDGYAYRKRRVIKGYNHVWIGLDAKDREFVEEFARCLAKVLDSRQIRPRYRDDVGKYVVEVKSKTLYEHLRKPVNLDRLKPYVEQCERCMTTFIRGYTDSEGSVDKHGYISITNSDLNLLTYIRDLLQRFNIESTTPRVGTRRGSIFHDPRTGKRYVTKNDCYHISI